MCVILRPIDKHQEIIISCFKEINMLVGKTADQSYGLYSSMTGRTLEPQ